MTETAGGGPRREDGPGATRTGETEIEIAIGDPDPETAIGAEPVQVVGAASGTRGTRETTAGAEATAETETEEAAIAFPGRERLDATAEQETTLTDGVPRAGRDPSRPLAETDMTAEPSAKPAQAARKSPGMELWCLGSWTILKTINTLAVLVIIYVIRTSQESPRP